MGNRLSSLGVSPYTYNSSNELQTIPGVTYAYDNDGNLQTKTDATGATGYTWDYENRLTQVSMPGTAGTVNYKYDPFGRRVQKVFTQGGNTTTTNYVYDGANVIEELDQFGAAGARYVQGPGVDEPLMMQRAGASQARLARQESGMPVSARLKPCPCKTCNSCYQASESNITGESSPRPDGRGCPSLHEQTRPGPCGFAQGRLARAHIPKQIG